MSIEDQETGRSNEFEWRETYFVLFKRGHRPTVTQVEHAISEISDRLKLQDLKADEDGRFASVMVRSPEDYAAIEISYEDGEAVIEQGTELAKQLQSEAEADDLAKLIASDARLDLMHFEQVVAEAGLKGSDPTDGDPDEDEIAGMLDPSSLLMICEVLVALTDGVAVDPASGAILA